MSTGPKEVEQKASFEDEYRVREERDALRAQLDSIRDALGNGADEELWSPGLTLPEAVRELAEDHLIKRSHMRVQTMVNFSRNTGLGVPVTQASPVEKPLSSEEDRFRRLLGNLLARIHRDGGHYAGDHGWEKACKDAEELILALRSRETDD